MSLAGELLQRLKFDKLVVEYEIGEEGKTATTKINVNYTNFYELVDEVLEVAASLCGPSMCTECNRPPHIAAEIRALKHVQPPAPNVEKIIIKPAKRKRVKA